MGVVLGQGFATYLLEPIAKIVGTDQAPDYKLGYYGFMNMLQNQDKPQFLRLDTANGQKRTAQVKYKQRFLKKHTETADDCNNTNLQTYLETSVDLTVFRQIAYYIEDERLAKYTEDAIETKRMGQPNTSLMNEFLVDMATAANALFQGLSDDLQALVTVGNNKTTGNNGSVAINIHQDTTLLPLQDGMTKIRQQYKVNQGFGRPQIIGDTNGLMAAYYLQQAEKGLAQNGLDTRISAMMSDFYADDEAGGIWGANDILVCQPNSVQIVEYMKYKGFKGGPRPGASVYGTVFVPTFISPTEQKLVEFDFQLKYFDCPTTIGDAYYGNQLSVDRGYNMILSKNCGLFQIPSEAYRGGDVLNGNNGVLRFTIANPNP